MPLGSGRRGSGLVDLAAVSLAGLADVDLVAMDLVAVDLVVDLVDQLAVNLVQPPCISTAWIRPP